MTSANPRRDAPSDEKIDIEIDETPGRKGDFKPMADQPPAQARGPESKPLIPAEGSTPAGPKDVSEKKAEPEGKKKKGKHKLDLVHKKVVKIAWWEWLAYFGHLVILYGWLILMMYLLLKATKDDARTTQIIYFALFLFSLLFLTVVIWRGQRARRRREKEMRDLMSGAIPIEDVPPPS